MTIDRKKWDDHALQPLGKDGDAIDSTNTLPIFRMEILPAILEYFDSNGLCLDIGCGNGRFSLELSRYFSKIDAIDVIQHFDYKYKTSNIEYHHVSFEEFENNNPVSLYKVIFFFGSFYTFGNTGYAKVIQKSFRLLSDDGYIIIIDDEKRLVKHDEKRLVKHEGKKEAGFYSIMDLINLDVALFNNVKIIKNAIQWNGVHRILVLGKDI